MTISRKDWNEYIKKLSKINEKAGQLVSDWIIEHGVDDTKALIDYSYLVAKKYGNGSASLSAAMYDALADAELAHVAPAELAPIPNYKDVAKAVNGTLKTSQNPNEVGGAVARLVKRCGADTTLNNAIRDRAEYAWISVGDSCAFCIALASQGWQPASKAALSGGHAEHIHSNCDCEYCIRFSKNTNVAGYNPDSFKKMYYGDEMKADGRSSNELINDLRRKIYAKNKEEINEQKREAEALRED